MEKLKKLVLEKTAMSVAILYLIVNLFLAARFLIVAYFETQEFAANPPESIDCSKVAVNGFSLAFCALGKVVESISPFEFAFYILIFAQLYFVPGAILLYVLLKAIFYFRKKNSTKSG